MKGRIIDIFAILTAAACLAVIGAVIAGWLP
jgi:hypothetical protein